MVPSQIVVLVADEADRRRAVIDALGSETTDVVAVETPSESLDRLGALESAGTSGESTPGPRPTAIVVIAVEDLNGVAASAEAVLDRYPAVPILVYAERLPDPPIRELFTGSRIEFVPSDASGADELLAAWVRRAAVSRTEPLPHGSTHVAVPSMLDDVSEAVFSVNPDWRVVYCNRAAEGLLGRERESALGRRLDEFEGIADTMLERNLAEAMELNEVAAFETSVSGASYDIRAYPSAAMLSVFARDVTERYERDRLFRAAFDGAMDAMLIADDTGRYVDVNAAAVELFGVDSAADLIGRSIAEFAPENYDVAAAWNRFRRSGRGRGLFPLVRSDGGRRVVEFAATRDVIEGRHLSVIRDVTEHDGFPSFDSIVEEAALNASGDGGEGEAGSAEGGESTNAGETPDATGK